MKTFKEIIFNVLMGFRGVFQPALWILQRACFVLFFLQIIDSKLLQHLHAKEILFLFKQFGVTTQYKIASVFFVAALLISFIRWFYIRVIFYCCPAELDLKLYLD